MINTERAKTCIKEFQISGMAYEAKFLILLFLTDVRLNDRFRSKFGNLTKKSSKDGGSLLLMNL